MNHPMLRHVCAFLLPLTALLAQQNRLAGQIDSLHMVKLPNSVHSEAQRRYDRGPVDPSTRLNRITLLAKRTPGQQADLEALLNRQQIPSSPDYHRWLTPAQFAGRFGLSETDIGKIAAWLASQGFQVEELAQARNWIACSGTAQQVAHTFGAAIHRYEVNGEPHFANATEVSIPEALSGVIGAIQGLHDFNPKPVGDFGKPAPASQITTGSHALTPADFATVYDVNPLYASGINGTGIQIVIVGASEIRLSDIDSFRAGFHLPAADPQLLLIGPSPGTPQAEEGEALIDLEWAGAVAPNASLIYVYSANFTDGVLAAIDRDLAKIISTSYADCEAAGAFAFDRSVAQQANAEGITWLSASGDSGAAGCDLFGIYSNPPARGGLAVNQPASFPEVTAVGGTQFAGDVSAWWTTSTTSLTGYSAISYIPETAWNETTADELMATGGGASMLFAKTDWQTGTGVPDDNARDVPDVSLAAASNSYVTYWGGFNFTGGGTSASTPSFAGVVALLNQYLVQNRVQAQPGLGNINPALYQIAKTVPGAFHDITTGTNIVPCAPGSLDCATGFLGFSAGVGYDPVTGLGSIDANQLITHWTNPAGAATVTTLAVPSSITLGDRAQLTATVAAVSAGSPAPTGTVNFTSGGATLGSSPLTASGATAIATLDADGSQLPVGTDTITATYTGDLAFGSSIAFAVITVNPQSSIPASSVFVSVTPNPDHAGQPLTLTLTEEAGVATTLTTFTENGTDLSAEISSIFGAARIPAFGRLSASGISPPEPSLPATIVANLGGVDDSGRQWSRQVSVTILSPLQGPAMALSSAPGVVQQNAAAASCQWSQQLLLQEQNGFPVQLTGLKAGATDLSAQIDPLFGTSHVAPFGTLKATLCQTGITPPQTLDYEIDGTDQYGAPVSTTLHGSFTGPASSPATLSASPLDVIVGVPDAGSATGSLSVSTAASWTVSVFPSNATTAWLTVSPLSGTGPASLSLAANASALRNGVYRATLILQGTDTLPQFLEVPVTLEAGVSQSMSIDGITNAASYQLAVAPGMLASVFGSQLAPEPVLASSLPLPLQTEDVAVTVNGVAAPLLYISPTQLNVQIPYETGAGPAVLGVNFNGQVTMHEFTVTPTAPGIFAAAGALVPFAAGKPGDTLPLFMTGEGDVSPFLGTNVTPPASTPLTQLPKPVFPVTVTVGGVPAVIYFIGIPSGLLGTQINFTIPPGAAPGVQPLVVTVNGVASPPVNLTVQP